ncbi:hypothetical protein DVH26_05530 [Paenibacillus sp. H1-7]|uniref:discoidin domain-containing protein n=1 Tax=Paenibacillus sp. H1-7 TaxID=2282849 RepID=UPI001EF97CCA|nr:discoidin domain-containing protein [Paenibacillus sp. H1-7]ULL13955.1 hypothetical protein DVH26_05530 [Paenibacillus sp. H1-7]
MYQAKQTISRCLAMLLFLSLLIPALLPAPSTALSLEAGPKVNLALNKPVSQSSDCSCGRAVSVVDGDPATFWQPLSADRTDGNVWITVDLKAHYDIDEAAIHFKSGSVSNYKIQTSKDNVEWQDAFVKTINGSVSNKLENVHFPAVNSRYVKLSVQLSSTSGFQLNEFSLYSSNGEPPKAVLESVYVADMTGRVMDRYDTVTLRPAESYSFKLGGIMSNGQAADLSQTPVTWESTKAGTVSVNTYGTVTALQQGVAKIIGRATLDGITKEASVWVDVYDPGTLLVDVQMDHATMEREIGKPALLAVGDAYPSVRLTPYSDGQVKAALVNATTGTIAAELPAAALHRDTQQVLTFPGSVASAGNYEIRLEFMLGNKPVYDALFFTVPNTADISLGESRIAYLDHNGQMAYAPDYRGNRILDFSNAGYMGGGVKIPDVQARIALEPGEGDDMARIQAAIDQVSLMPQDADGFRGAILLKKGTYEISGTLYIQASGVVLRGEGQGEDGTILYATGTAKRNILEIKGQPVKMLEDTAVTIADLFVPSGSRSFHVDDASGYQVGDKIKVRRYGNDRWIHEIDMDTIHEIEGTVQWTPFSLDFDRVITGIQGNVITIDAPIANSIEQRWGGGAIVKYEDPNRLEQVGVENLRVDSEFDPSVTATQNGKKYFSDENHAVSFAIFTHVTNAWMREVTGLHLNHALAHVGRGAKWVTIQDNQSLDMVSVITGERRYPFKLGGELTLMQRNYAETARHAFIVDSRVQGPNVFLDSQSVNEYASSEPHHRWSVGGLYDNVKADIAIQDRGSYGTGHGWSGANYVAWNTEGDLIAQQPPTAQNYAIGHVGAKVKPYLPNGDDNRPRSDGYWESFGFHVSPTSLYLQQLEGRLGAQAVQNIAQSPVGGGNLDIPALPSGLPLLKGIKVNNKALEGFTDDVFEYTLQFPAGTTVVPDIRPHDMRHHVEVIKASTIYGKTVLIVRDKKQPSQSVQYQVRFNVAP